MMGRLVQNVLFFGVCIAVSNAQAEYIAIPKLGANAAYTVEAISETDYNNDSSGRVFKDFKALGNGELVSEYYRYELNPDKSYGETFSQTESGSGDGIEPNVDAGAGLNNTGNHADISDTLYKNNKYTFDFTGADVDTYVRGGAVYNGGVIGNKDTEENFFGTAISADFIGNSIKTQIDTNGLLRAQGGALANQGEIGDIRGDFIQNSAEGRFAWGGALYNDKAGAIGNIEGDFVGNHVQGESSGGGALINEGKLGLINGDFIANYAETTSYAAGGAIHNNDEGILAGINGNFVNNSAKGAAQAYGGAIDNLLGEIGNINGDFNNNAAVSGTLGRSNGAFGGAISNQEGKLGAISGNFIGNQASAKVYAQGGAVFNSSGEIERLDGDFIGNQAVSANAGAYGGAIYNENASVQNIRGDFSGNQAIGKIEAKGGAIYSINGTDANKDIQLVNASFYNNAATAAEGVAQGGAVYADRISVIADGADSVFHGNTANGANNAIYMDGSAGDTGALLKLETKRQGNVVFDDAVGGEDYDVQIFGDGSGEVIFNNRVDNAKNFALSDGAAVHLGTEALIQTQNYIVQNGNVAPVLTLDVEVDRENNTVHNGVIQVSGDVSGTTDVVVNSLNRDKLDDLNDAATVFLQALDDDMATYSGFNISRVTGSPYMWEAVRNYQGETDGSTWYLAAKENADRGEVYAPEIPAYVGIQSATAEQNRGLSRKIGNGLRVEQNKGCCDKKYVHQHNMWVNADYDSAEIDVPAEMDADIKGATAGVDMVANRYHRLGLWGAYRHGDYDLSGRGKYAAESGSELDIDSYLGGLYYRYGRFNWSVLAIIFGGRQDIGMKTDDKLVSADTKALQYGASFEAARKFYLPYAWIVEPSLGVYYTALDIDGFADNMGKNVDFDLMHYVEAELGLRFEHLFCMNGWTTKLYVKPSVIQTYASGDNVKISGMNPADTYENQVLGKMEIGAKFGLSPSVSAYTSANYMFGSDYSGYGIDAGLNYAW